MFQPTENMIETERGLNSDKNYIHTNDSHSSKNQNNEHILITAREFIIKSPSESDESKDNRKGLINAANSYSNFFFIVKKELLKDDNINYDINWLKKFFKLSSNKKLKNLKFGISTFFFLFAKKFDYVIFFLASISSLLSGCSSAVYSFLVGHTIRFFSAGNSSDVIINNLNNMIILYSTVSFTIFLINYFSFYLWNYIGFRNTYNFKKLTIKNLLNQKQELFDTFDPIDLNSMINNKFSQISNLGTQMGNFLNNCAKIFSGLFIGFLVSWKLSLILLCLTPFIIINCRLITKYIIESINASSHTNNKVNSFFLDNFINLKYLHSCANYELNEIKFKKTLKEAKISSLEGNLKISFLIGLLCFLKYLHFFIGIYSTCYLILNLEENQFTNRRLVGGDLSTTLFCIIFIGFYITGLLDGIQGFESARSAIYDLLMMMSDCLENFFEKKELKTNKEKKLNKNTFINKNKNILFMTKNNNNDVNYCNDKFNKVKITQTNTNLVQTLIEIKTISKIEFKDVYFSYNKGTGNLVFKNLNFFIEPGKIIGIIGENRCGKSSIVNLLEKLYEPDSGEILVNTFNLKDIKLKDLRRKIAVIQKDPLLFNTSIKDNIIFFRDSKKNAKITQNQIDKVAKDSLAYEFISKLPKKFDYQIGLKGNKLNLEQKIKINIARALLLNPEIIIFDEALSDFEINKEKEIYNSIIENNPGITIIILTQKVKAIIEADNILAIEDFESFEFGRHEKLIENNGYYAQLYQYQKHLELADENLFNVSNMISTKDLINLNRAYIIKEENTKIEINKDKEKDISNDFSDSFSNKSALSKNELSISIKSEGDDDKSDFKEKIKLHPNSSNFQCPDGINSVNNIDFIEIKNKNTTDNNTFNAIFISEFNKNLKKKSTLSLNYVENNETNSPEFVAYLNYKNSENKLTDKSNNLSEEEEKEEEKQNEKIGDKSIKQSSSILNNKSISLNNLKVNIIEQAENKEITINNITTNKISSRFRIKKNMNSYKKEKYLDKGNDNESHENNPIGKNLKTLKFKEDVNFNNEEDDKNLINAHSMKIISMLRKFSVKPNENMQSGLINITKDIQRRFSVAKFNQFNIAAENLKKRTNLVKNIQIINNVNKKNSVKNKYNMTRRFTQLDQIKSHIFGNFSSNLINPNHNENGDHNENIYQNNIIINNLKYANITEFNKGENFQINNHHTNNQNLNFDNNIGSLNNFKKSQRLSILNKKESEILKGSKFKTKNMSCQSLFYFKNPLPQENLENEELGIKTCGCFTIDDELLLLAFEKISDKANENIKYRLRKYQVNNQVNVFSFFKKQKGLLFLNIFFACLSSVVEPLFCIILSSSLGIIANPDISYVFEEGRKISFIYLVISLGPGLIDLFLNFFNTKVKINYVTQLKFALFSKLQKLHLSFYDISYDNNVELLINTLNKNLDNVYANFLSKIEDILKSFVLFFVGIAISFSYDYRISLIGCGFIPIIIICLLIQMKFKNKLINKTSEIDLNLGNMLLETIKHSKTIFCFNIQKNILKNYLQINKQGINSLNKQNLITGLSYGLEEFINFLAYALSFYYGGCFIIDKTLNFGMMLNSVFAVSTFLMGLASLQKSISDYPSAKIAIEYLFNILNIENFIDYNKNSQLLTLTNSFQHLKNSDEECNIFTQNNNKNSLDKNYNSFANKINIDTVLSIQKNNDIVSNLKSAIDLKGRIEFKNVYFSYPNDVENLILKGLSFVIYPGQKIAIVGSIDSGKSCIVDLLEKFYDISHGEILIDDVNIKEYDTISLRKNIGLILNDSFISNSENIFENIRYGNIQAEKNEIFDFLKEASLSELVELNDKFTNDLNLNLTQAQKRKLFIARESLKKPKIFLFEENMNAFDLKQEKDLNKIIDNVTKNKTSIKVLYRLKNMKAYDQILILDNGRIIERGNHKNLMNQKGLYYELYFNRKILF